MGSLFSQASSAKQLIVSVAPSYPAPVSLMTAEDITPSTKKLKFEKKEEPATIQASYEKLPGKNEIWKNIFLYISQETGIDLVFEPATSQLDFELNLAKSHYDLAFLSPLQFEAFRLTPGYQAQIKRKAQPIRAIIFVKKNGHIKSFSELRNAIIAFPNPLNFESSIVPRESLKRLNFNIIPQFLPSETAVYKEVISEQYIAGSGTHENFLAQPVEIRNSLKIVWDSPGFTPHAFVAHPRVGFFSLIKLKRAFVDMIKNEEAKKLLPYIFVENGFEVARDSDWDEIKLIDLNELNGSIKNTHAN
tara:strand:- start:665 stop:1576 length:912 start_codon:yes stop_codon:yes gene_type:complete